MNRTRTCKSLVSVTILLLMAGVASAGAPNGIQHIEESFDWPEQGFYIPCLDDTLNGTIHYTLRTHSFQTPSGTAHMIESFYGIGYIFSKTTGNTWIVRFAIPINGNSKIEQGQNYKLVQRENYIPDEGNGRHFFIESWYNLNVDANGELKVEREVPAASSVFPDDYTRCVGKPN